MKPKLTLESSLLTRFPDTGEVSVSVQASSGRSMVQDTKTVRVYGNPSPTRNIHEETRSLAVEYFKIGRASCRERV